jgi:GT2 family glycosyltransferase
VSVPILRRLYYGGRDALPLGLRRAIRRLLPVERIFRIRKPAPPDDALPALPREDAPGRPDIFLFPVAGDPGRGSALRTARAIAALGGRVFLADRVAVSAEPAFPGVVVFPALDAGVPGTIADVFGVRHAVSVVADEAGAERAEALRQERGWPVLEWGGGAGPSDAAAHLLRRARAFYPLASIVIVTYGNLAFNRACLESLLTRTAWPSIELVFVDNASADGTREWLERERSACPVPMTVIANAENRGFAAAVNQGLAAASGEFLCLLNNDTVVTEGWLSALVAHLETDPRLGMVGSSTNEIANEARVPAGYAGIGQLDAWALDFTRRNRGRRIPIPMLAMFCVAMRRPVWEEIGPLDERFAIGMFEDDDYSRRMRERGYTIACARDSFVHHRGRASFASLGDARYRAIFRENERRYREKWGEAPAARPDARAVPATLASAESPVVFLPTLGWNAALFQRPQHLARAIAAAGHPVVFDCGERGDGGVAGYLEIEPRLYLYAGPRRFLAGLRRPIVWSVATNVPAPDAWPEARLVYDAIDHLDVFPGSRRRLERGQLRALRRAERVFAVSRGLRDEIGRERPDAIYLPNGVDAEAFRRARRRSRSSRPSAIYVGALARWFDFELLAAVAAANPEWDFLLYGEELDGAFGQSRLAEAANVQFRGARPNAEVPQLLAEADVAVIPFRVSAETAFVSPIKLYEYFAAGKPPISSPMPEASAFPEVRIAASVPEWTAALAGALADSRDPAVVERLRALGRAHDWSRRGREALSHLLYSPH